MQFGMVVEFAAIERTKVSICCENISRNLAISAIFTNFEVQFDLQPNKFCNKPFFGFLGKKSHSSVFETFFCRLRQSFVESLYEYTNFIKQNRNFIGNQETSKPKPTEIYL